MGIQDSIISYVRSGIVSGKFKPGQRLKGREYFCEKFSTTPITVQRAFNRLIERGFVTAEKSVGTFVAEKPTCLNQIAFLFASTPASNNWTSFSQVVVDSIPNIEKNAGVVIKCFYGMGHNEDNVDVFNELEKCSKEQTLVAAIYLAELRYFRKKALSGINIPYYDVAQPNKAGGQPRIELKKLEYYQKGTAKFKELGRKRIAIVTVDVFVLEREEMVKEVFSQYGMEYYEPYVQSFNLNKQFMHEKKYWVDRFLRLLFSLPDGEKPDGIFITDDNFVDITYNSLVDMGLEIGKDIDVIAHANFSSNHKMYPGLFQLGYSVPQTMISACKNLLVQDKIQNIIVMPELR
jgi:DNA-binding LacI/PurR family transcriptional regulator